MLFRKLCLSALLCSLSSAIYSQGLITNIDARKTVSLNGQWQYIVDPYETGFYDYRYKERAAKDPDAYWNTDRPKNKMDKKEHGYSSKYVLRVPGDWNSQDAKFLYYEGTIWYKRSFDFKKTNASDKVFLYFGAVNYRADVYLNGKKLGMHKGGFTPFNFEVPDSLLKVQDNFLVVKVDNKRYADEIPTLNTDWWNYGGITREVKLVSLPASDAIVDYFIQLKPHSTNEIEGRVNISSPSAGSMVTIEIPELSVKHQFNVDGGVAKVDFSLPSLTLWSPGNPKRYKIIVSSASGKVQEQIGFRTIEVKGKQLLLNGSPVFLRGISIHEEIPQQMRRAYSKEDAAQLFSWVRELGCNMVRLAHYPHDESMTRMADSLGILVWSEIPVYWTIDFSSAAVLQKAKAQLNEMITRDHNRASIIIWSVGNETPVSQTRTAFMKSLLDEAHAMDPTRLAAAALEVNYLAAQDMHVVNDPLGEYVDVVAFNEYLGWYGGTPASCRKANWSTIYNKPLFISETGAEALGGYHADSLTLWSEEYQAWYYREQVAMLKRMPDNFVGISPWILADFRSPRRNNPIYQNGWNNKGLVDQKGRKKKAFFVLKQYYAAMKNRHH
jgi:beta-glucuronidase